MREFSAMHPTDLIPVPPDTIAYANISTAGAVVTLDYPTGADQMAIGSDANYWLDAASTGVTIPTTTAAGSTSNTSELLRDGTFYQIPGPSTGFSLTAGTSQVISVSFWKK